MKTAIFAATALIVAATTCVSPTLAQFETGSVFDPVGPAMMNQQLGTNVGHVQALILKRQLRERAQAEPKQSNPAFRLSDPETAWIASSAAIRQQLSFTPSPTVRRKTLMAIADRMRGSNREAAKAMDALIAEGTLFAAVEASLKPYSMTTANLADAYTIWMINAWSTANGDTRLSSPQTIRAVRDQITRSLGSESAVLTMTDAQRQAIADELVFFSATYSSGMESLKNEPAELRAYSASVQRSAAASGFNISKFRLTEQGFVPRR